MTTTYPTQPDLFPHLSNEEFDDTWNPPPGIRGWLAAVQNQPIGMRFIYTSFLFFTLAGILALGMRLQLIRPENTFLNPETYNRFFTMHGSTMMFLFLVPLIEGIATLVLPQMFGSRELPFPRLTAFAYWSFLAGGLIFYLSFFVGEVPDGGWFAYVPLTNAEFSPGRGMDYWLLGLNVAEIGAIAGAIEIILAFFKMRAPGMSLARIPIFAWAMVVTAFMMIFAFTPLIVGSLLLEVDRKFGTHFYNVDGGGSPLLWQHIFWIFGHPDVYIQFVPAVGMISTIIPVFSRRRLIGYNAVILSLVSVGFLSFGLWVHHMFTTGLPELTLSFFGAVSALIAIPSAIQIFAWIATMARGRLVFKTPMLFAMGFFTIFIIGGITGVMVAAVPFDFQVHDSYFVVAHFHYVLFGGSIFPIFGGIYFWAPKFVSKQLDEGLGRLHFWLLFVGFNVTFFPMHISGMLGMPRRVYTYQSGLGWDIYNLISTIGAFIIALSILVFFINVARTLASKQIASANPWDADTLEWATPTPSPQYGFRKLPIVQSRHPLWDQEDLHKGTEQEERLVETFALWPTKYRAQLVVTTLDARPQEVMRIAGPSLWPLVASVGAMLFSFFLIYDLYVPVAISGVITLVAFVLWHHTNRTKKPDALEQERIQAFEALTGVPIVGGKSPAMITWTMLLAIISLGIVLMTLVFVHLYLRLQVAQWPPEGTAIPDAAFPSIATFLVIFGSGFAFVANSGVRRENANRMRFGLVMSIVIGVVALALLIYHALVQIPFTPQTNAYGSSFFVLWLFQTGVTLICVAASLLPTYWSLRLNENPSAYFYVGDIARLWYAAAAFNIVILGVLYLVPHLL